MTVMWKEVSKCKEKEKKLLTLLQAKAKKLSNNYLTRHKHTQLSYLPKEQQEFQVSIPKGILLDRLISYLNSI